MIYNVSKNIHHRYYGFQEKKNIDFNGILSLKQFFFQLFL